MKFEEFENHHIKLKNQIMILASVVITMLVALIFILEGSKRYAIYKSAPFLDHKFLARDICYEGFYSIVKKSGVSSLVQEDYLEALEQASYVMIDFEISKSSFKKITMQNQNECKIILSDKNTAGHGLRSFKVTLIFNSNFIFDYKIDSISEVLLSEGDL